MSTAIPPSGNNPIIKELNRNPKQDQRNNPLAEVDPQESDVVIIPYNEKLITISKF